MNFFKTFGYFLLLTYASTSHAVERSGLKDAIENPRVEIYSKFWDEIEISMARNLNRAWIEGKEGCKTDSKTLADNAKTASRNVAPSEYGVSLEDMLFLAEPASLAPIKVLNLRLESLKTKDLQLLSSKVKIMTNLTDLYLGGSILDQNAKKILMLDILPNLGSNLEILDLEGINLNIHDVRKLVNAFSKTVNLRILYLGSNNLGDIGFEALLNGLPLLPKLQLLSIKNNNISSKHFIRFGYMLPSLRSLQILDLKQNSFTKNDIKPLVKGLLATPNLVIVDFDFTGNSLKNSQIVLAQLAKCRPFLFGYGNKSQVTQTNFSNTAHEQ